MEFKKFNARTIKTTRPIISIATVKALCEDLLTDLGQTLIERDSLKFCSHFFPDFNKVSEKVDWKNLFVLDGVGYLHKSTGTKHPLVKNRDLFFFLYVENHSNSAFSKALLTNPWLNEICVKPAQLMSQRVLDIRDNVAVFNTNSLMKVILENVSENFTPRGVWGLDYMFLWKIFGHEPEKYLLEELSLVQIDEYLNSFQC